MVTKEMRAEEFLEMTAEMLGQSLAIPKARAYGLIKFGEEMRWIRKIGMMPTTTGRGRGATIYRIPVELGEMLRALWANRKGVQ